MPRIITQTNLCIEHNENVGIYHSVCAMTLMTTFVLLNRNAEPDSIDF